MIRLAWRNLRHQRSRTLTALGGIAFAILLLFMQIGFYVACKDSAARVHGLFEYDLLMTSQRYTFIVVPDRFPRERLRRIAAAQGVAGVSEVRIGPTGWRPTDTWNPADMLVVGLDPADPAALSLPDAADKLPNLSRLDHVLFDRMAHPSAGRNPPGTRSEVNGRTVEVADEFNWGAGFSSNCLVLAGTKTYANFFPYQDKNDLQLGLIRLEDGLDPAQVRDRLAADMPADVRVWTADEIRTYEEDFFLSERPVGLMFTSGVVLAIVVGSIIFLQVLSAEVNRRRAELATLQALGYSGRRVGSLIFAKGLLMTLAALIPMTLCAWILYETVEVIARLPMALDAPIFLSVAALSLMMSAGGSILASRRIRLAKPADLF